MIVRLLSRDTRDRRTQLRGCETGMECVVDVSSRRSSRFFVTLPCLQDAGRQSSLPAALRETQGQRIGRLHLLCSAEIDFRLSASPSARGAECPLRGRTPRASPAEMAPASHSAPGLSSAPSSRALRQCGCGVPPNRATTACASKSRQGVRGLPRPQRRFGGLHEPSTSRCTPAIRFEYLRGSRELPLNLRQRVSQMEPASRRSGTMASACQIHQRPPADARPVAVRSQSDQY